MKLLCLSFQPDIHHRLHFMTVWITDTTKKIFFEGGGSCPATDTTDNADGRTDVVSGRQPGSVLALVV